MLLTIERVALLKRVSLFARTPDRVLAGLARTLEEETFPAGTTMTVEGAVEDWLFVLIDGSVQVTQWDRVRELGPGDVVGELAVLASEPRVVTAVALTDVHAFRLRKVDLRRGAPHPPGDRGGRHRRAGPPAAQAPDAR